VDGYAGDYKIVWRRAGKWVSEGCCLRFGIWMINVDSK
jgi:hypothetical protein